MPAARLLVQESVADELLDRLKRRLATLRLGDPLDKNTDIGAINSADQLDKIPALSEVGEQEGAERWSPPCELPDRGWWFPPTLFTGVTQAHRIAREEIFGPVLSVLTFRTPAEALEKANNTPFGLSAGVWTDKGSRILWMAQRLRAGVVWANTFNRFDPTSPFGGYKESGYGREGGRHGLEGYLRCLRRPPNGSPCARPTSCTWAGRSRAPSRAAPTRSGPTTAASSPTPRWPRARTPATRWSRPRKAFPGWSAATAYNRGQVLYRVAELLEGRRDQFVAEVADGEGLSPGDAAGLVDAAVDRWVWYAGWSDKVAPGARLLEPGGGPLLRLLGARAHGRGGGGGPGVVAARPRVGARPRHRDRQHVRGRRRPRPHRCPRSRCPRCWPRPTSPAGSSTC